MSKCIECNIEKKFSEMVKGKTICKICYEITPRICPECNVDKHPTEYEFQRLQCKVCRNRLAKERERVKAKVKKETVMQTCIKCNVYKFATKEFFIRGKPICRECNEDKSFKIAHKICNTCNIDKDVSEYKTNAAICKICYNQHRLELAHKDRENYKKKCETCNDKYFGPEMYSDTMCKKCRTVVDRECNGCKLVKPVSEFNCNLCKKCNADRSLKSYHDKKKDSTISVKTCGYCNIEKDKIEFTRNHGGACNDCYKTIDRSCKKCNQVKKAIEYRDVNRLTCIDCERLKNRNYRRENPSTWAIENQERMKELQHNHYKKNKTVIRQADNEKYHNNTRYKYYIAQKAKWQYEIKNYKESNSCVNVYREWLKYNFSEYMNMDNYGSVWNIDHVIPCSYYYATEDVNIGNEFVVIFDWRNTKPDDPDFNMAKKSKLSKQSYDEQKKKVLQFCRDKFQTLLDDSIQYFKNIDTLLEKYDKKISRHHISSKCHLKKKAINRGREKRATL